MVVSAHDLASKAGIEILRRGGNAVDAAVATGFVLAVVYPEAGNVGGGGFMTIRDRSGNAWCIDFRETAPGAATRTMYLDSLGRPTDRSVNGHLSAGVPGTVAGLLLALERFGTMKAERVLQPAIELAERGFVVDRKLHDSLVSYSRLLEHYASTVRAFSRAGNWCAPGDTLRQPDLANTLRRIAKEGRDGFYRGETARLIVEEMHRGGGMITGADLERYEAVIRAPLAGTYRGYTILAPPPPSSGGLCLLEMLNMVERYDLAGLGFHSAKAAHLMTESMKRTYADRAEFMGDPAFVRMPVDGLISKSYAADRCSDIDAMNATPSSSIRHGEPGEHEGRNTTHFVVVDSTGEVVATTYTLNDIFGSKVAVEGAGFLLNDEMDDFSVKPGAPNLYGLIGGDANAIAGNKRPLSSMTPTILVKDGKAVAALGARGGSRIITAVLQAIVNMVDFGMNVRDAIEAPRFHHQWIPDTLYCEHGAFGASVLDDLAARGYVLGENDEKLGAIQALSINPDSGWIEGANDPREGGSADGY